VRLRLASLTLPLAKPSPLELVASRNPTQSFEAAVLANGETYGDRSRATYTKSINARRTHYKKMQSPNRTALGLMVFDERVTATGKSLIC
jgi:hypothetical protein